MSALVLRYVTALRSKAGSDNRESRFGRERSPHECAPGAESSDVGHQR
jgi:hypothetical protein